MRILSFEKHAVSSDSYLRALFFTLYDLSYHLELKRYQVLYIEFYIFYANFCNVFLEGALDF